jgi:hypothetical protein
MDEKANLSSVSLLLIAINLIVIFVVYIGSSIFINKSNLNLFIMTAMVAMIALSLFSRSIFVPLIKNEEQLEKAGLYFLISSLFLVSASLVTWFVILFYDPGVGGEGDPLILLLLIPMWIQFPLFFCFFLVGTGYSFHIWLSNKGKK